MKKLSIIFLFLAFLLVLYPSYPKAEEKTIPVPAVIQISSMVSDGKLSVSEIVRIARQNNIKVVILTDRDIMRWEYGLWPWPNLIKKVVEENSIFKYGLKRYLKMIKEMQKADPDILLIPGLESAPFYCWEGHPLDNNFKMYNWHKHILVIGLEKMGDIKNLPSVCNRDSLTKPFTGKDIYLLWPILILLVGFLFVNKREFKYEDWQGRNLGPYSKKWRIFGICLIIFSLLSLFNNFPFHRFKYSQYSKKELIEPYQGFIDYVNQKGGSTFWAHPEAEYVEERGQVGIETREHTADLLSTHDYTGFAIFYEGYQKVGCPGGIWDVILKEYCDGKRSKPIWAVCGLSFDQEGNLNAYIKDLQTVLLIPHLDKVEVLKALREGKMYVANGKNSLQFILDKCIITDALKGNEKTMGEEITLEGAPQLQVSGHFLDKRSQPVAIKLIRNGEIVKTFEAVSPFNLTYFDQEVEKDKKIYYRLEVNTDGVRIITNPIFVNFTQN